MGYYLSGPTGRLFECLPFDIGLIRHINSRAIGQVARLSATRQPMHAATGTKLTSAAQKRRPNGLSAPPQ